MMMHLIYRGTTYIPKRKLDRAIKNSIRTCDRSRTRTRVLKYRGINYRNSIAELSH